jgi:hypothetical protein
MRPDSLAKHWIFLRHDYSQFTQWALVRSLRVAHGAGEALEGFGFHVDPVVSLKNVEQVSRLRPDGWGECRPEQRGCDECAEIQSR